MCSAHMPLKGVIHQPPYVGPKSQFQCCSRGGPRCPKEGQRERCSDSKTHWSATKLANGGLRSTIAAPDSCPIITVKTHSLSKIAGGVHVSGPPGAQSGLHCCCAFDGFSRPRSHRMRLVHETITAYAYVAPLEALLGHLRRKMNFYTHQMAAVLCHTHLPKGAKTVKH